MDEYLRKTGIGVLGDMPWGTHFCQFYRTREDLLDILVPYFRAGLENNEYCMWVTSEPLGPEEALSALRASVPGLEGYIERGQIEIIPHTDWYLKGGSFDSGRVLAGWVERLEAALRKGFVGLRLTGNTFWLEREGWDEFTEYERVVNGVIGRYRILALCTYSLDRCDLSDVVDVVSNHRFALIRRAGSWSVIESSTLKQAEHRLLEAESRYKALFEQAPYGIIMIDPDTALPIEFNDTLCAQLGYTREEFSAKRVEDYEALETPAETRAHIERVLKEGRAEFETRHRTRTGELRDVFVTLKVLEFGGRSYIYAIFRDITKRKRQEQALHESESRYRSLFENMVDGAAYAKVLTDSSGAPSDYVFIEVNRSFERILGMKRAGVLGRRATELFPGLERAAPDLITIFGRVALTGESREFEFYWEPMKRWFSASVYSPAHGFFVCVFSDISEKKTAEQALMFERNKLIGILGAMDDGVYIVNDSFRVEYLNPVLSRRFGPYDGRACYTYLHGTDSPCEWCTRERVFKGETVHGEWTDTADGRTYDILSTPLRNPDGSVSKLEIMRDITERKRAEEKLLRERETALAEAQRIAHVGSWEWDLATGALDWSDEVYRIFGFDSRQFRITYELFLSAVHPEDRDLVRLSVEQAVSGVKPYSLDHRIVLPTGEARIVHEQADIVPGPSGAPQRMIGIVQDVTERRRSVENLRNAMADLERSNKELEQFAYIVSHDLQEPLRMIVSYLQLIEDRYKGRLDETADEFIYYAVDGAKRMSAMIHDILTYSRAGRRGMPMDDVDCAAVIDGVLASLKMALDESGAEVRVGPMPRVTGDATLLAAVFQNLLENAVKFRRPGESPVIDISADRKGAEWVFTVSDNGIGIERQFAERIFLIFQRLHGKEYPGTGIGLAVCKKIIERHGGRIWVESSPGVGSKFRFTVPAAGQGPPREALETA